MKNILLVLLLSGLLFACGGNEEKDMPADDQNQEQMDESTDETADTGEDAMEEEKMDEETNESSDDMKKEDNTATSGKTTKATSGGWTGKVVKLADVITGNYETLSADRVKELVLAGQYVGFLSDGTFYMVYNAGGNYDWKNLARVAGQESVKIEGKVKMVNGISIIMATNIAS